MARNKLYEHFRRTRKDAAVLDVDEISVMQIGTSPSGAVARGEEQQLVREALEQIPSTSREVLTLRYWEGLRGRELANRLGIGEGAVRSRLRRAREQLEEQIGRLSPSLARVPRTKAELTRLIRSLRVAGPVVEG